jgi:hypothetical protein
MAGEVLKPQGKGMIEGMMGNVMGMVGGIVGGAYGGPAGGAAGGAVGGQLGEGMAKDNNVDKHNVDNVAAAQRSLDKQNAAAEIQKAQENLKNMDPDTQKTYGPILDQAMQQSQPQQSQLQQKKLPLRSDYA